MVLIINAQLFILWGMLFVHNAANRAAEKRYGKMNDSSEKLFVCSTRIWHELMYKVS
jgi:hypothetical protein